MRSKVGNWPVMRKRIGPTLRCRECLGFFRTGVNLRFWLLTFALVVIVVFSMTLRPFNQARMKPRKPTALRPCQGPGCLDQGKLRSQHRMGRKMRTLYLCAGCFGDLSVVKLNDLFLPFAAEGT
jgi:hypothetical protein